MVSFVWEVPNITKNGTVFFVIDKKQSLVQQFKRTATGHLKVH